MNATRRSVCMCSESTDGQNGDKKIAKGEIGESSHFHATFGSGEYLR